MIETTNNIIFYAGYFFLFSLFLLGGILILYGITRPILDYKQFALRTFNRLVEKQLKGLSDEDFEKWIKKIRKKYRLVNSNK